MSVIAVVPGSTLLPTIFKGVAVVALTNVWNAIVSPAVLAIVGTDDE